MQVLFESKITTVSWRKKEEMRQNTVGSFLGMQRFKVNVSTKTFFTLSFLEQPLLLHLCYKACFYFT